MKIFECCQSVFFMIYQFHFFMVSKAGKCYFVQTNLTFKFAIMCFDLENFYMLNGAYVQVSISSQNKNFFAPISHLQQILITTTLPNGDELLNFKCRNFNSNLNGKIR